MGGGGWGWVGVNGGGWGEWGFSTTQRILISKNVMFYNCKSILIPRFVVMHVG